MTELVQRLGALYQEVERKTRHLGSDPRVELELAQALLEDELKSDNPSADVLIPDWVDEAAAVWRQRNEVE